jgi:hypothetical protein
VQFDFYEISFLHFYFLDSFSFKILSAAAWPHPGDKIDVSLPAQIEDVLPEIEEFYKKKHSGRKLTWYHTVSNGQVRFIHRKNHLFSFIFSVNLYF